MENTVWQNALHIKQIWRKQSRAIVKRARKENNKFSTPSLLCVTVKMTLFLSYFLPHQHTNTHITHIRILDGMLSATIGILKMNFWKIETIIYKYWYKTNGMQSMHSINSGCAGFLLSLSIWNHNLDENENVKTICNVENFWLGIWNQNAPSTQIMKCLSKICYVRIAIAKILL